MTRVRLASTRLLFEDRDTPSLFLAGSPKLKQNPCLLLPSSSHAQEILQEILHLCPPVAAYPKIAGGKSIVDLW